MSVHHKPIMPKYSNKSAKRVQMFIGLTYLFIYIKIIDWCPHGYRQKMIHTMWVYCSADLYLFCLQFGKLADPSLATRISLLVVFVAGPFTHFRKVSSPTSSLWPSHMDQFNPISLISVDYVCPTFLNVKEARHRRIGHANSHETSSVN